jgi:hypothetical protein
MDCNKARKFIVLDHYGELPTADAAWLAEHLKACRACAAELEDTKRVFALIDKSAQPVAPLSDPDRAWQGIQSTIRLECSPERRSFRFGRRWALAGVALAFALVAGIFIGRNWLSFRVQPEKSARAVTSGPSLKSVLASHFEALGPVLIDYANSADASPSGGTVAVDMKIIQRLQLDNALLKRTLAGKDPAAAELLDDIDLILREISHQESPEAASPTEIRDLIRQRDVLFKMNIIKTL